jgi:hypothetical protein
MKTGKDRLDQVQQVLQGASIEEAIEVLGNVFLQLGFAGMDSREVTTRNVVEIVMQDIKKNGDTLHNSLARQGLVLLSWLDQEVITE